jgi:hypothetical protein
MQWVLIGQLDPAVSEILQIRGDRVHAFEELNLSADAPPRDTLLACQSRQWDLLTDNPALALAPLEEKIPFNRSIVLLQLRDSATPQPDAISRLFDRYKRLSPHRLYTLTPSRVKIRQLPE